MSKKKEQVELENMHQKVDNRKFDLDHAERILNSRMNKMGGGWFLPKDSKYSLKEGKLIGSTKGTDTGDSKKSEKQG